MADNVNPASQLLPQEWKIGIQKNFKNLCDHLHQLDEIITLMFTSNLINPNQQETLKTKDTNKDKIDMLITGIVMRLDMKKYLEFINILKQTGNEALARLLPGGVTASDVNPDQNKMQQDYSMMQISADKSQYNQHLHAEGAPAQLCHSYTEPELNECKNYKENYRTSSNPDQNAMEQRHNTMHISADNSQYNQAAPAQLRHSYTETELNERKEYEPYAYPKEEDRRGLVVIFAFFTGHLIALMDKSQETIIATRIK